MDHMPFLCSKLSNGSPTSTAHSPRLLSVAFNISADNSSRASPECTLNPGQPPQLWSQRTGVSYHCKYVTICDQ